MKLQRFSPDSEPPGYLYGSIGVGLVDELLPTYWAAVTPLDKRKPLDFGEDVVYLDQLALSTHWTLHDLLPIGTRDDENDTIFWVVRQDEFFRTLLPCQHIELAFPSSNYPCSLV